MKRAFAVAALALGVAACQGKQDDAGRSPAAEVLPGSASDAMIAYDTLKSQPPLDIPSEPARGRDAASGAASAAGGDEAFSSSEAAPDTAPSDPVSAPTTAP